MLALTSNSKQNAILNPTLRFTQELKQIFSDNNIAINVNIHNYNKYESTSDKLISTIKSAPLYALLSLANSESHNFTSEMLLRNASSSWNNNIATKRLTNWATRKGINPDSISFHDGSGLSRSNLVTTNTLVKLLFRMKSHQHFSYYLSSLSIPGIRGTLKDYNWPVEDHKLFAKTGTLTNVKSLSGYLSHSNGLISLSFISNGIEGSDNIFSNLLYIIRLNNSCFID